jgi:nucleotide-binding universal stress UspA family protein
MIDKLKILIPTDFSIASDKAVEFALEFTRKFDAEIILIHINAQFIPATDVPFEIFENEVKVNTDQAKFNLSRIAKEVKNKRPDVKVRELLEEGEPVSKISSEILKERIDLIIMGTHGKSEFKKLLFGSVSSGLIEEAVAPMIVVPENYQFEPIKNIVYASNFLDQDVEAIKDVGVIAKAFGANVQVLHIDQEEDLTKTPWKEKFEREVLFASGLDEINFDYVYNRNIHRGIQRFVADANADLLVMLTRKRGLFEKFYDRSFTEKFSFHLTIPLMIFHKDKKGNAINF